MLGEPAADARGFKIAFLGPLGRGGGSSLLLFLAFDCFPASFPAPLFRRSFDLGRLGDLRAPMIRSPILLSTVPPSLATRTARSWLGGSSASSGSLTKFLVDLRVEGCDGGREYRSDQGNLVSDLADLKRMASIEGE